MSRRLAALVAIALLAATPAAAQKRADRLLGQCQSLPATAHGVRDLAYCRGYLNAVLDINAALPNAGGRRLFCAPRTGVTDEALRRIFVAWVASHPKDRPRSARSTVLRAFRNAFPCKL